MSPVTKIVISDPELRSQLLAASGQIVFEAPDGHHIQTVETVQAGRPSHRFNIPFTDEELDQFSKERTGRSLDEILTDLKQKHGE
jgi:hypothetical protein